jgi:hypothetical protein
MTGLPYLAEDDVDLIRGRLRTRPLLQAINNAAWPKLPDDPTKVDDFLGPERRRVAA